MSEWVEYTAEHKNPEVVSWGKDHWSTFAYLETRAVDHKGVIVNANMRCDARLHRHFANISPLGTLHDAGGKYPTRMKGGATIDKHDDWSCLEDMVAAGLIKAWMRDARSGEPFGGYECKIELTPVGQVVAGMLRSHKMNGGKFEEFMPAVAVE